MKKSALFVSTVLFVIIGMLVFQRTAYAAAANDVKASGLISVVDRYSNSQGVDVVKVGSLGTSLLKGAIKHSAKGDEEAKALLKAVNGIKRIAILDFDGADVQLKQKIQADIDWLLAGSEVLMEVKGDGDTMYMYGVMDEKASQIHDFVLYAKSDCALICLLGSISVDAIMKLAE